jgi:hypothetical protein
LPWFEDTARADKWNPFVLEDESGLQLGCAQVIAAFIQLPDMLKSR